MRELFTMRFERNTDSNEEFGQDGGNICEVQIKRRNYSMWDLDKMTGLLVKVVEL